MDEKRAHKIRWREKSKVRGCTKEKNVIGKEVQKARGKKVVVANDQKRRDSIKKRNDQMKTEYQEYLMLRGIKKKSDFTCKA